MTKFLLVTGLASALAFGCGRGGEETSAPAKAPSRKSAAASHDVQMVVMGTRGLSGLDHVLLGSVTERVIRKAEVPVFAVK